MQLISLKSFVTNTIIYLIIILLLGACRTISKHSLFGKYVSHIPLINTGKYTIGNELYLYKDSTFKYDGCGQHVKGRWLLIKDNITLFCNDFNYKNDSLNKLTAHLCNDTIPYESFRILQNGDLLSSFKYKNRLIKNRLTKSKEK